MIFLSPGSQLKQDARKLMLENAPKLFFVSLLFVAISAILSELTFRLPGNIDIVDFNERLAAGELPTLRLLFRNFRPMGITLAVIISLLRPILNAGFIGYCIRTKRKQETEYRDIFSGFIIFHKIILIFLLSTLFILLWSLLLIIPGIVALYKYRLAYYILIDDPRKGALQCLNESAVLMNGSKVDLLIIDISFMGWHIANILLLLLIPVPLGFPLLSIWLTPYIGITLAGFYEKRIVNFAA